MDTGITKVEMCKGWCNEPAEVVFHYPISRGRQSVHLCTNCARIWWDGAGKGRPGFKNTTAGMSIFIEEITGS